MGIVYVAVLRGQAGFTKLKVVKRLRPDLAGDTRAVSMFNEEARLAARLSHPNIVQTNEAGFDGRHHYIEMEYLEGQSYETLVRRSEHDAPVPLAVHVFVLSQTLAGLEYAHGLADFDGTPLGVVHRDVSPHNVMITYDGAVKLVDFGIARADKSAVETQTGLVKGKLRYMAPEQAMRGAVDRRTDVFAVGAMLFRVLGGGRLYEDLEDVEVLARLRDGAIPDVASRLQGAPRALVDACVRALAARPEDRFPSAAAMKAALDGWASTQGEKADNDALAAIMGARFGDVRTSVRAEIEGQLRLVVAGATASDASVPVIRAGVIETSDSTALPPPAARDAGDTKAIQAHEIRGLRRIVFLALAVTAVASVALALSALRGRGLRANGTQDAAASALRSDRCSGNAACTRASGRPSLCRVDDGACVPLEAGRCTLLSEPNDATDDRTLWLGVMFPTTGPVAAHGGTRHMRAADLARRDFAGVTHGIPSSDGASPARPLAFVACDDAEDAAASAHHLANELRLPAVLGFKSSTTLLDLAPTFMARRMLVVTVNVSAMLTSLSGPPDAPRLVWRPSMNTSAQATPASRVVSDLVEPRLRQAGIVSDAMPLRVAYIRPRATYALATTSAVVQNLRFNGRSVAENGDAFRELLFDDPMDGAEIDFTKVVDALVAMQPHVVLFLGEDELAEPVFGRLEARWSEKRFRPTYVSLSDLEGENLFRFIGKDAGLRRRFFGVSLPAITTANTQFTLHYNQTFGDTVAVSASPGVAYDAVYLLAYAAFAAGDGPLTGPALSRSIGRLVPPGKPLDVGPSHIVQAIDELRAGRNVDLQGAVTRMDLDPATGETTYDYAVQCVGVGPTGAATDAVESGLVLPAGADHLRGTLRCP
jgi:ABC-type branched-subunit amino acid transport system substrate-binding protein/tRNA A-37 threonylcarbamoyl transferase component Bud32